MALNWLRSEHVQSRGRQVLFFSYIAVVALMILSSGANPYRNLYYVITLPCFALVADRATLLSITRSSVWRMSSALIAYTLASMAWSEHHGSREVIQTSRDLVLVWVFITLTAYLTVTDPRLKTTLFRTLTVAAALVAIWRIAAVLRGPDALVDARIWMAGIPNANISAAIYGTLIVGGLFYAIRETASAAKLAFFGFCLVVMLVFAGLTQSRGTLIALVVALVFSGAAIRARWVAAGGAIVVAAVAVLVATNVINYDRLAKRGDSYRLEILEHYLATWRENPWFGIGALSDPTFVTRGGYPIIHEHNVYVAYLVQGGAIGFAIFVAMLLAAMRVAWLQFRKCDDFGLVAILIFVAICIGTDFMIFVENIGWQSLVLWLPMGLSAGAEVLQSERK